MTDKLREKIGEGMSKPPGRCTICGDHTGTTCRSCNLIICPKHLTAPAEFGGSKCPKCKQKSEVEASRPRRGDLPHGSRGNIA